MQDTEVTQRAAGYQHCEVRQCFASSFVVLGSAKNGKFGHLCTQRHHWCCVDRSPPQLESFSLACLCHTTNEKRAPSDFQFFGGIDFNKDAGTESDYCHIKLLVRVFNRKWAARWTNGKICGLRRTKASIAHDVLD